MRFSRYALPGLERTEEVRQRLAGDYRSRSRRSTASEWTGSSSPGLSRWLTTSGSSRTGVLWPSSSDGPRAPPPPPSSPALRRTPPRLLFDGIERETLPAKCSGVFVQEVFPGHPLTEGLGPQVHMPHSRLNDLPSGLLQAGGYTNLIESPEMNWTVAVKDRGRCTFVLVQGHPEYSTTSLLREYRRDMQRFLRGERARAPAIPVGYMDEDSHQLLESFEARAHHLVDCDPELMNEFPFESGRGAPRQYLAELRGAAVRELAANDPVQEAEQCMTRPWRSTAATRPDETRAVAVPVYQTIAHEFDDAAHAGAVFDLEIPGFHYNRLNNPTNAVLEARLQALEGGAGAVTMSSGAAAVNYSILNLASLKATTSSRHRSFTARPTRFSPMCCPSLGITVRFADDDRPECIEPLIDSGTKADLLRVGRQPGSQRGGPRSGERARPPSRRAAHRRQHDRDAHVPKADRARSRRGR